MVPRIRQIQIRNYKSIDRAVVDLEPFTVLVGPNGAGKTNFIDALAFVQECLAISIPAACERHGSIRTRNQSPVEVTTVGIRLLLELSSEITADYSFEIQTELFTNELVRERCTILAGTASTVGFEVARGQFIREIPGIRPKLSSDRLALFAASALDEYRPIYDFLTSMRFYSIEPAQLRKLQPQDSGEVLKAEGGNAASVLHNLHQLSETTGDERYQRLCKLLARLVPGIRSVKAATGMLEGLIIFEQDTGNGNRSLFDPFSMSDGTLRILGLLLALYQPQPPSVLLIEEPEATIHPAAVELVTQILLDAAQERQVLITTHSPDILDFKGLSDEQIRVVSMEHGHTVVTPLAKASRQAIRDRLYTPGELLRIDELASDIEAAERLSSQIDLFGETPAPSY
jgi:predicted ATPase